MSIMICYKINNLVNYVSNAILGCKLNGLVIIELWK